MRKHECILCVRQHATGEQVERHLRIDIAMRKLKSLEETICRDKGETRKEATIGTRIQPNRWGGTIGQRCDHLQRDRVAPKKTEPFGARRGKKQLKRDEVEYRNQDQG